MRVVRWLIPPDYRQRMHDYFDDYGCMRCDRTDVLYKSNGMCRGCLSTVFGRLQHSVTKRSGQILLQKRYGKEFVLKAAEARKLLAEFSRYRVPESRRRSEAVKLRNPVSEVF
jgi:hypothetical protein